MHNRLWTIYVGLALSAAAALIYEVVATHVLLFYFVKSTYSVSTVLSVFLFGLGVGSFIYYKLRCKIANKRLFFGILQAVVGLYGFLVFMNIGSIVPSVHVLNIFIVSSLVLLPPTIFLGMVFPLSAEIVNEKKEGAVGLVYYIDLMGAVAGSLLSGFWLIPFWGNKNTIFFGVFLSLLAAFLVLNKKGKSFVLLLFLILLAITFSPSENRDPTILFQKSSAFGEITLRGEGLYIDDRAQCFFDAPDDSTERRVVNGALSSFNSRNLDVVNIGLGCGGTLQKVVEETNTVVDVVEINPVVVEVNRMKTNILDHERVNLIVEDGVSYLRDIEKKYDSVIIDIEEPAVVHASDIYTLESFRTAYSALNERGVLGLWTPPCKRGEYYNVLFNTLSEVFPYVYQLDFDVSIASKQKLPYEEYVLNKSVTEINTLDKKALSRIYLEYCGGLYDDTHFLEF